MPVKSPGYEADGRNVALCLVRAVDEGRAEDADRLAGELAAIVLAEDRVTLAGAVRDCGPLRITRALRLAELVLGAAQDDDARAGEGVA